MHNIYLNFIEKVGPMKYAFIPVQKKKKKNQKHLLLYIKGKALAHQIFTKSL